ncbi:hypothetical protein AX15_001619 [Amanita polypyramis BW_CC]|nr:hypothetical protein AX15_001619 [Amanita polypyramis BW_CC]
MSSDTDRTRQEIFQKFKPICVLLMGTSLLIPATVPSVSALVSDLLKAFQEIDSPAHLTPSLISYIFLPLSTILRRNPPSAIPDQLLEKMFMAMAFLCDNWWWTCEMAVWEQVFMLCGAVIGGIESKGKGKDRDDETKKAAAQCLLVLLRDRTDSEALQRSFPADRGQIRKVEFVKRAQDPKFVPILGQTLNSVLQLLVTEPSHHEFQLLSLELTFLFVDVYVPDYLIPSVLPGVVSAMTKVALGTPLKKGWTSGEIVASALKVMQNVVVKAISDAVCIRDGALSHAETLEALVDLVDGKRQEQPQQDLPPYATGRTSSWLRGTSSQVHIAINTLGPLLSHPTPSAHVALSKFSFAVLGATPLSLPLTQPVLLSYLLSLSMHDLPSVSDEAREHLLHLFSGQSTTQHTLLQTLMQTTRDTLQTLPHLISRSSDSGVEQAAKLITAVSHLSSRDNEPGIQLVSSGIGKLLGPTGGIEKWGWSLLSVLELVEPLVIVTHTSVSQLMLEIDPDAADWPTFPNAKFRNVTSTSATEALEQMFHSLGRAGRDHCLFAVEWFADVGLSGVSGSSATAMWCACRLLEGVAAVSIAGDPSSNSLYRRSKSLEKLARELAKNIAEIWDVPSAVNKENDDTKHKGEEYEDSLIPVEHVQGVKPISETLGIIHSQPVKAAKTQPQPLLHRGLSLQLLAVTAGILQSQFPRLFIYTLYPVLHSLISTESYLSLTALATLKYITVVTSYASPANLLLSNFDYALDSVSRRLTRRWLDVGATKVLVVLVRLVGKDVVERAGDVVEECFDRLDDYHEYSIIVEGLVEVLGEVIAVIRLDDPKEPNTVTRAGRPSVEMIGARAFLQWYHEKGREYNQADTTDYGPAPRTAWGSSEEGSVDEGVARKPEPDAESPPTPIQALTQQIVTRSVYFLTHGSPLIRARILTLLSSSAAVLPESALMPSIHSAWPFILNRLSDKEPFVVSTAASLIEALTTYAGDFMFRRIWDDIWPRFRILLDQLNAADSKSALARRGHGATGTESAYTHSHRLYQSIINTMTATIKGVHPHESSMWQVTLAFRRFLSQHAHEELQARARDLYLAIASRNVDIVRLALTATSEDMSPVVYFLREDKWKIESNSYKILNQTSH